MSRIYVASSWRNDAQPFIVWLLRSVGHDVYDFRNPTCADHGFAWSEITDEWQQWSMESFRDALAHPVAQHGFESDFGAMQSADLCVLVLPCGRSAHLEAGYFVGAGKPLYILLAPGEPELMYSMATKLLVTPDELLEALALREQAPV